MLLSRGLEIRLYSYMRCIQMHAGIAEIAAAKARMFVNKPDGSKSLYSLSIHCLGISLECGGN